MRMNGLAKKPSHKMQSMSNILVSLWIISCLICIAIGRISISNFATLCTSSESSQVAAHDGIRSNNKPTAIQRTPISIERIRSMRTAAKDLIDMLEEYYEGTNNTEKLILGSWLSPWEFNSTSKLVDTMARAIVTEDQDTFTIGIIGSSVAAGSQNCVYDNYPSQLERTFSSVWKAGGMKLAVQNTGVGECGDSFTNQVYCIQQLVSPQTDVVHYSWTYYEAGFTEKALESRESLIRWTQLLRHQPPVHVLNIGPFPQDKWNISEYNLSERYSKYGYNAFYTKAQYNEAADSEMFVYGHVGDSLHNTTRYGQNETDADRKESLGVMMRSWHPGPFHFQFISDTFSYIYSQAILKALDILEDVITKKLNPAETWDASKRPVVLKSSLPAPLFCDLYCSVSEPPKCTMFSSPTFGLQGASIEGANGDLNPHKGEPQKWSTWEKGGAVDLTAFAPKDDRLYFEKLNETHLCDHKWVCNGISASTVDHGSVVFRLPKSQIGMVAVCGMGRREHNIGEVMFLNNTGIEIQYNGQVLNRSTWNLWPEEKKCVRLLQKFVSTSAVATTGHDYLKVTILNNLTDPVRISHVITL